jgi:hypothetical protein
MKPEIEYDAQNGGKVNYQLQTEKGLVEIEGRITSVNTGRDMEYDFIPDSFTDEMSEEYWDENWEEINEQIVNEIFYHNGE